MGLSARSASCFAEGASRRSRAAGSASPRSSWMRSTSATRPRSHRAGMRHAARRHEDAGTAPGADRRGEPAELPTPLRLHLRHPAPDTLRATGLLTDEQPLIAAGTLSVTYLRGAGRSLLHRDRAGRERLELMLLSRYEGIAFALLPSDCSVEQYRRHLPMPSRCGRRARARTVCARTAFGGFIGFCDGRSSACATSGCCFRSARVVASVARRRWGRMVM